MAHHKISKRDSILLSIGLLLFVLALSFNEIALVSFSDGSLRADTVAIIRITV